MSKLPLNRPIGLAFIAIAVLVLVVVVVIAGGSGGSGVSKAVVLPSGDLGLSMTANKADSLGADPKAGFKLSSGRDLDASEVKAALVSKPAVTLKVEEKSKREFQVTPMEDPGPDATFSISFKEPDNGATLASWAYQVRAPLRVVSTLPADQRPGVALDSGIELTFSSDNVINPQANVEISPATPGRFEQHKRTLVFVPQYLQPLAVYTVTVKPGLKVDGSDATLEQPFSFQFETTNTRQTGPTPPTLTFQRSVYEIATAETPSIAIRTTDYASKTLPVEVYAYPDQKSVVADVAKLDDVPTWSYDVRNSLNVSTTGLTLAMKLDAAIEDNRDPRQGGSQDYQPYIHFAARLPAGFYLVQATYAGKPLQAWLEITDVATYVSISNTKTIIWTNDVAGGGPIGGAKVELAGAGGSLGTTNDQGVLQIDTPKQAIVTTNPPGGTSSRSSRGTLLVTDSKGRSAVVPLSANAVNSFTGPNADYRVGPSRDYWHFITSERPIYQTTDTVHVWGVARAREGDIKRELQLELKSTNGDSKTIGLAQKVETDEYGAFQAEVPLQAVGAGYYSIAVEDLNGDSIDSLYVTVSDYVKPAYRIDVTPSKLAVTAGDDYDVQVKASFYDGTPVVGAQLKFDNPKLDSQSLTTGADGIAQVHTTAKVSANASGAYDNQTITVTPTNAEDGEISGAADIVVFPAAAALRGTAAGQDGKVTLTGDLSNVDLSSFTAGLRTALYPYYGYSVLTGPTKPAFLTTPIANAPITIDISESRSTRTEIGERYDFINKVTTKVYKYDFQRVPVPTANATTDAQGHFTYSMPANDGSTYQVTISAKDAQGRTTTLQTFAYGSPTGFSQAGGYATVSYDQSPSGNDRRFAEGEKVALNFKRAGTLMPAGGQNRYLFYQAQRGIKSYAVQDNPVYNLTFSADSIPSVDVGGVYFNGSTYVEALFSATLRFDPAAKGLKIALTTPKQSYGPGDEATVQVAVTDAAGKPVQAEVNLAAVDAAIFDLVDTTSYVDVLQDLYTAVPSGIIHTYTSHQYPVAADGPGGKGGGGGAPRQNFADVAYFGSLHTDASGKAEAKFKLPDNLTSWRLTAYGVTKDLQGGRAMTNLLVTQPFFVDVSVNPDYLTTDKPQIRARGFGSGIKTGDPVQVSLTAPSLGLKDPMTVSGKAFEPIDLALPQLTPGEHDLRIEATSGSQKDVVIRKINVVPSRLLAPVIDYKADFKPADALKGSSDGQTTVVFADAGRGRLLPVLQKLQWSYGDRLDQTLARVLSAKMLNQYFGQDLPVEDLPGALYLQSTPPQAGTSSTVGLTRKGVAMLPQASPDLTTTALSAALAPGSFGQATLSAYLQAAVDDPKETSERQAIAYYGLASLNQPVLLQLQSLSKATDLGWRGRLYLALAFKAAGDDTSARKLVDGLSKDYNEDQTPLRRLRVGTDQDDILEATSLMAVLEAGLNDNAADAYFGYLQKNAPKDVPDYMQQLLYLQTALARNGANDVSFTYTLGGKKSSADLQSGKTLSLSLSQPELAGLRVDSIKGRLSATATYLAPLTPQDQHASPDLTIRRSYLITGSKAAPGAPIPEDSRVEVTLELTFGAQAPGDCYQVTDLLPSGLKPVTRTSFASTVGLPTPPRGTVVIRPNQINGQRVTFCVAKGSTTRFTYYARVTGAGSFTWEPAVMNARSTPSVVALSQAATVQTQ